MLDFVNGLTTILTKLTLITLMVLHTVMSNDSLLDPAYLPTVYMPEKSDHLTLSGFNRAIIHSQRGPRYPSNLDCTLTIQVRDKYAVQLTMEHMDLAQETYGSNCEDFLQLYSGPGKETILTQPYCGQKLPRYPLVANTTSVTVRFRTNHFRERTGFRMKFERVSVNELLECESENGLCVTPKNAEFFAISKKKQAAAKSGGSCLTASLESAKIYSVLFMAYLLLLTWQHCLPAILSYSIENR